MMKAFAIASLMAFRGLRRNSLTSSGAVAAFFVGFLSISCGPRGMVLLLFYLVATKATKYKSQLKSKFDQSSAESSCRGPSQVLACSALGVVIQLVHVYCYGEEQSIDFANNPRPSALACSLIAHHATSLADTLASELGILAKRRPILITTGQSVPPGTNGGVTLMGTGCSALGGFIIGLGTAIVDKCNGHQVQPLSYLIFGTICGIFGSFVDSILGATVQATYFDPDRKVVVVCHNSAAAGTAVHISGRNFLTNAQVNVASIMIASTVGYVLGPYVFP